MLIVYITDAINTPKYNDRQTQQIENSLSSSDNKIAYQGPEYIQSNVFMEFSYFLINKFCEVFKNKISIKRLSICKNIDKYENIVRFFHTQLALFV